MINALTIDVEDYWKILSCDWLKSYITPTDAIVRNTNQLLDILQDCNIKATFFFLGEIAKKFPNLLRQVVNQGHEIGVHGFHHCVIYTINEVKFYEEISSAKKLIEDTVGINVEGHRAPSFSIMPKTKWALEMLSKAGYRYDSSIFPFRGRRYGWPGFSRDICEIELPNGQSIIEVPMSTVKILGKLFPACGGGYLRHFPYFYTDFAIRSIIPLRPVILYMHPYDFDTEPGPKDIITKLRKAPLRAKFHHIQQFHNRHTVIRKLRLILNKYQFAPIREIISNSNMKRITLNSILHN